MTKYNFDKIVDRRGSGAFKTDALNSVYGREDLIPLWVADMEFETPDFIVNALKERLKHPVFGYTVQPQELWPVVKKWISEHHNWEVECDWLTFIPGIVKGIGMAINALLQKGDKIIIQPPVYHPFRLVPQKNGYEIVHNPLKLEEDGTYSMDFENLEKVCDQRCKMLILSNPHNPAGMLWSEETLKHLADFCHRRGVLVVSDEIHCDMALWGRRHIPFASVSKEAAECSITFASPSKTFNIAGIVSSYAVVPSPEIRKRFFSWLSANEMNSPHMFAPIATIAAFKYGEEWRREMLKYVEGNIDFVINYCAENIPSVKPLRPQASFLVWLDCRGLGLDHESLVDLFVNKAQLALNDGEMFNPGGEGFMRMNVGTSREILKKAMDQLKKAL